MTDFFFDQAARRQRLAEAFAVNPEQYAKDYHIARSQGMPTTWVDERDRNQAQLTQAEQTLHGLRVVPNALVRNKDLALQAGDDLERLAAIERISQQKQLVERLNQTPVAMGMWSGMLEGAKDTASATWQGAKRWWYDGYLKDAKHYQEELENWHGDQSEFELLNKQIAELEQAAKEVGGVENLPETAQYTYHEAITRRAHMSEEITADLNHAAASYAEGTNALNQQTFSPTTQAQLAEYAQRTGVAQTWYGITHPRVLGNIIGNSMGYGAPSIAAGAATTLFTGPAAGAVVAGVGSGTTESRSSRSEQVQQTLAQQGNPLTKENIIDLLANKTARDAIEDTATKRGIAVGAVDALTMGIAGRVVKPLVAAGHPIAATGVGMATEAVGGSTGELAAQLWTQDHIDTGAVLMEGIAEIATGTPEAVTLVAHHAKKHLIGEHEQKLGDLTQITQATQQSTLRQRAPELFAELAADIAENADSEHLYLDANALHQSGLDKALLEASPSQQQAYEEALATGGAMQIPLNTYLTDIAPNAELSNALGEHVRFEPDGLSLRELTEHSEAEIMEDVSKHLQEAAKQANQAQISDSVRDDMLAQLNQAGNFTEDANRQMATLASAFYSTMAERLGTDAQSLYAKHPLNIVGTTVGQHPLNQALAANPPRGWIHAESGEEAGALWRGEHPAQAVFWTNGTGKLGEVMPELAGYSISINRSAIEHIQENHSNESKELARGQLPITEKDIANVQDIIQNYDDMRYEDIASTNNKRFAFARKTNDGVIVYIADSSRKRHDIHGVSMWKYPATTNVHEVLNHAVSLVRTSATEEASFHSENPTPTQDENQYYQAALTPEQQSFNTTAEQYGGEEAYQQAKAEGKTELDYHQWVQVRTPEFKEWFGDWENDPENASKVVNPRTGEPLVVYHGTQTQFDTFDTPLNMQRIFLTTDKAFAQKYGKTVMPLFANARNVIHVDDQGLNAFDEIDVDGETLGDIEELAEYALGQDYDGVMAFNVEDIGTASSQSSVTNEIIVFNPNQIKSATDNVGAFNPENPNIYYQLDEQSNSAFSQAIDSVANGEKVSGYIKVGTTPDVLKMLGLPDAPVTVGGNVIHKVIQGKHNVTTDTLKQLPQQINNPVAVMKSRTKDNGYVVLTELTENVDGVDKPLIAALHLEQTKNGLELIKIASAYGRNKSQIKTGLENDLLYWHTTKGPQFLNRLALQLRPGFDLTIENLSANNIKTDSDLSQYQAQNTLHQHPIAPRGQFSPDTNTIALLENADLSTFQHELGHFFLESLTSFAQDITAQQQQTGEPLTEQQQQVLKDVDSVMNWFGTTHAQWQQMNLEEKRAMHEQFARGFEAWLFEGKAPSLELHGVFQRMRAWLLNVYRRLTALNVKLTDEVREVYSRLVASDDAIRLAEQNRSMAALFTSAEEAGMDTKEFADYQREGQEATQSAIDEMQARVARDSAYFNNLRHKAQKKLERQASAARAIAKMAAREAVMRQPVYRVWDLLTHRKQMLNTQWQNEVNPKQDDLFTAIAKLGGVDREEAQSLGVTDIDPVRVGFPVLRKQGRSLEELTLDLSLLGYLPKDADISELTTAMQAQKQGEVRYSAHKTAETSEQPVSVKLDAQILAELGFSEAEIAALGKKVTKGKDGVHPDALAMLITDADGKAIYENGSDLVRDLLRADDPKIAIDAATDDLMLQNYGELSSPEAIAQATEEAIHNDIRLRVLAREANALAKAVGKHRLITSAAKRFAQDTISRLRIRDIRPAQYSRMESRAAKASAAAFKKGDLATAAAEKRNQLLQAHLHKAAMVAREEVAKHLRYLKRVSKIKPSVIDREYREQLENILAKIDFGNAVAKNTAKTTLAEWLEAQRAQGFEPDIDPRLLSDERTPYDKLTLEALRGVVDSLKQIEHLGRVKNQLLTAQKQQNLQMVVEAVEASIHENSDKVFDNNPPATKLEKWLHALKRFGAAHMKVAMLARMIDGSHDGGAMWEYFIRPANAAANREATMRAKTTEKLAAIMKPLIEAKDANVRSIESTIRNRDGSARRFTRSEVFAVALNMGNEGNLQRLLDGENWTIAQVHELVSHLTAEQWQAVQQVWHLFDSFRPEIGAKEERVYGKSPEWIEATPFTVTTADGQTLNLEGGYYPIKYDPSKSQRANQFGDAEEAAQMMKGAFTASTTKRSFTKSRVNEVKGRPLLLNLSVVYSGLNDIIHDLAWHEYLIDANKLLRSHQIDTALRERHGAETINQFKHWLKDIAAGDNVEKGAGDSILSAIRQYASVAGLGFNLLSALKQPLGLTQTAVRVGYTDTLQAIGQYLKNPVRATQEAVAQSEFMANRARTRFRELNEVRNSLEQHGKIRQWLSEYSYMPMLFVQQIVDVITWHGEYNKHIAKGVENTRAVALADQAVIDAQGGGELKDLSAIERDRVGKVFTVYYSFMNTALNLAAASAQQKYQWVKRQAIC